MKKLFLIIFILLPQLVWAEGGTVQPTPLTPSNITVIDGKKFFSLSGARHYQGSTTLSPSAQAVVNHPKADYRLPPSERLAMTPVTHSRPTSPQQFAQQFASEPPQASASISPSDAVKQELLSIFAPDDKPAQISPSSR